MSDLAALIEKLSAATGPSRELDCAIWEVDTGLSVQEHRSGDFYRTLTPSGRLELTAIPHFTSSIDAALTLVPDGAVWRILTDYELPGRAHVHWPDSNGKPRPAPWNFNADAATPALALCIAALRARTAP